MILGAMLLLLALSSFALAAEGDIVNASPYLRMGVGARFLAMGGASTASVDDATATYWNVAGLTRVESASIASMYSAGDMLDRRHNFLALASSFRGIGSFGIAWINSGVSGIQRYNENDQALGSFNSSENAFLFSYGAMFQPVRIGAGIKILHQKKLIQIAPKQQWDLGGLILVPLQNQLKVLQLVYPFRICWERSQMGPSQ
jgi:hypothetical protein